MPPEKQNLDQKKPPGIFSLLKPYGGMITLLLFFALLSNGINLLLPKIIATGIDAYTHKHFDFKHIIKEFGIAVLLIFIFGYLQHYTNLRV
jgi:ATP-binding cassette subfamily B protein